MLDLNLLSLRNPERFQDMCLRIAQYQYPHMFPLAFSTHDGGRDGEALLDALARPPKAVVIQTKFVPHPSRAKRSVKDSLEKLDEGRVAVSRWILCLPVDPTADFKDWLLLETRKRKLRHEIWGRKELLRRLEKHPDVVDTFFYAVYAEIARHFRSASLELLQVRLDRCQWKQPVEDVLEFFRVGNVASPALVLDVLLRNVGTVDTALTGIEAEVFDHRIRPHGVPSEGLLFSQITYRVSIKGGVEGRYIARCEEPLKVPAGGLARFKLRVTETGYSWNGGLRITLQAGARDRLRLPAMRLYT